MNQNTIIKKMLGLILLITATFLFVACDKKPVDPDPIVPEKVYVTVTFNSNGGGTVDPLTIEKGLKATAPTAPTKDGFTFNYWYTTDEAVQFDFNTVINANVTLNAKWTENIVELTTLEKIEADFLQVEANLVASRYKLNIPTKGPVHNSTVRWSISNKYITSSGFVIPVLSDDTVDSAEIAANFTLNGETVRKTFTVPLSKPGEVFIQDSRVVEFENLTTEYNVADGELELFFEEDGSIPYVSVITFLNLLSGFVDPEVDFETTLGSDTVEIRYEYYDEDEDHTYDLRNTIDATNNTISTNDPGFFWAYIYSTETNYGRHITYDNDHPDASYIEGSDIVYELGKYGMDIVVHGGEILVPYYIVNQLYAGSSYYNVYYNSDKLYGIYSLPDADTPEYDAIRTSSKNGQAIPEDLLMHTFNSLAFNLDYFYGLREVMDVETYYDLLFAERSRLLTTSALGLDSQIASLLLKKLDEPHTSYGYPGYYNTKSYEGPSVSSLSDYGTRFNAWYYDAYVYVDDAIEAKFGREGLTSNAWAAGSLNRTPYWFINDTVAVLILDSFSTSDIVETETFDVSTLNRALDLDLETASILPSITGGNRYFTFKLGDKDQAHAEFIVKGLNESYVTTYEQALVAAGFEKVVQTSSDPIKAAGYFKKTVSGVDYMVQMSFSTKYNVFYLGIISEVPETYTSEWPMTFNLVSRLKSDSAVYMEIMLEALTLEKPTVTNIVFDISWNSGGNVGALYRVVGFMTDDAFKVSRINAGSGSKSTSYIKIEGLPSFAHLEWSLLITPKTFSAGNSLATIFMENDLGPIMGIKSGGGAASITPILLPNGTAFTMSSNSLNGYRTGTGTEADPFVYVDNEFGIEPDYVLTYAELYSNEKILEILASLK
ncbi:InlB B-repeat-containing protein [Acholeplasma vituli]|uniref:InlB B-repeat-containing protein n=1 Tax=Paracholeplasma vituli TaxID=69473 RepID=A0ABT2PX25_9MOLU|nr:InlB B-repeat-containing protein [Paracholeplasma vituli]MCU0105477.1 InlB B-repeat-containing protein [Paracholeplasma vituli]